MARGRKKKIKYSPQDENPQLSLMPEYDFQFIRSAVKKVLLAWELHTQSLKNDSPMLLAFSGGKDSVCLYYICKKASEKIGVPFEKMFYAQYNITNLDPPELVQFVRKQFPDVKMHHPEKTFWKLLLEKKMPPFRSQRWCCAELKEISSLPDAFSLTGVRRAESRKRADREGLEGRGNKPSERITLLNDNDELRKDIDVCSLKRVWVCNPLIDWSDEQVWAFIRHENLPYCCLYDEGFHRLGCIGCPLSGEKERERDFKRWPKYEEQYIRTFQRLLDLFKTDEALRERERERRATPRALLFNSLFIDGQDMFDWWMYRPAFKERHRKELEDYKDTLFEETDNDNTP